jgi:hypothetical protein
MELTFYVLLSSIKMDYITLFSSNKQYKIIKSYSELLEEMYDFDETKKEDKIVITYIDPNYNIFDQYMDKITYNYSIKYVYANGKITDNLEPDSFLKESELIINIKTGSVDYPDKKDFDNELLYEYALTKYTELLTDTELEINDSYKETVLDILETMVFDKFKYLGNIYRVTQESYMNLWTQSIYNNFSNPIYPISETPVKVIQEYNLNDFKEQLKKIKINKNFVKFKDEFYLLDLPWFDNVRFYTINGYCISFKDSKINIERIEDLIIPEKTNCML